MLIAVCKSLLVGTVGVFFALVAYGNVTDYETNWHFVQHVLAMDTIFPDSTLRWRAITDPRLAAAAYRAIITWEAATAIVLLVAAGRMVRSASDSDRFAAAKPLAVAGLTMGLLLYGLGFLVIAGEWFAMWQSRDWNGTASASHFITLAGLTLLAVLAPDRQA